ncbi:MAG TPA: FCD domain-containing protein [Casimicrobiaceae bacterium]|nr:FCD domain-containing protein [Casimicrobiaceae bacterium]
MSSLQASSAEIEAISELLERMKAALRNKRRYIELSQRFSLLLKNGCENILLNDVVSGQEKYLRWLRAIYYTGESQTLQQVHEDHVTIFEKFRQRDLTGLLDSVARHVNKQRERVLSVVAVSGAAVSADNGRLSA